NDADKHRAPQRTRSVEMKSVKFGTSASAEGCVNMCGMCPPCAFAPEPPGATRCLWKVSDEFERRFVVGLLLRCGNTKVLEGVQRMLGVTSWTLFAYARSLIPGSFQRGHTRRGSHRTQDQTRPLGMHLNEIWDWFSSSPDWIKSRYLCSLFSLCDLELLRMFANLTSVLLVRQKRGFLQFNESSHSAKRHDEDSDEDSEDPALMVVPGSSKSVSGVSRYRDFISCLPVDLSKRILGLLDENTLRRCQKVSLHWQHLAQETLEEIKFRRIFQDQIKAMKKRYTGINKVSPTYANIVEVPVPAKDDEKVDIHADVQKVKPFQAAYAKVKTKTVKMEERNVYCGAYFTTTLLDKEDPHRVMDYRGGPLMATGSKDRMVHLFRVASETKAVSALKGHSSTIRVVLLCEGRGLVITAGSDASIRWWWGRRKLIINLMMVHSSLCLPVVSCRCWEVKTHRCVMALYGHTGTVHCLDTHADKLVSGAKDCLVKVWSLQTGKRFEGFNFKHPSSVRCVRISARTVYSSCDRGLVKIWDIETASLLRVIDAHRSSVKCLFFDEWHFLSGDSHGQVMAWSVNCDVKESLMTFSHPKEVRSLTLLYLRVVTGCADGKIRVFNFLTGDCLRDITAEAETGRILSLHLHDHSILVNTTSGVKRYQFAKVFWDYTEPAEGGQGDVVDWDGLVLEKSDASLRELPFASVRADRVAQTTSPSEKKTKKAELLYRTCILSTPTKCRAQAGENCEATKQSVMLSEKATTERVKRRGLHHPLTRDSILLRVNAIQKARCVDEVSINMEYNARLRDAWGPHVSLDPLPSDLQLLKQSLQTHPLRHTPDGHHRRAKTCVPILKRSASQSMTSTIQGRNVSTAPDTARRPRPCLFPKSAQSHSADTHRRASGFTTECVLRRLLPNPECSVKNSTSLPRIGPAVRSEREQGRFRPPTVTHLQDCIGAKRELVQN
ncbi:hypothetical protein L3Q82_010192, partial [Scortum barcoo]